MRVEHKSNLKLKNMLLRLNIDKKRYIPFYVNFFALKLLTVI